MLHFEFAVFFCGFLGFCVDVCHHVSRVLRGGLVFGNYPFVGFEKFEKMEIISSALLSLDKIHILTTQSSEKAITAHPKKDDF